jgi:hypothetical protein
MKPSHLVAPLIMLLAVCLSTNTFYLQAQANSPYADTTEANPAKRKLVVHPKDWPWSSWSHYVKGEEGLIRMDSVEESGRLIQQVEERKSQNPHP